MIAFVLSGGGSRGAVHVGMLRALSEAGIEPDALYATSVGAINAAALSHLEPDNGLAVLTQAWKEFASQPPIRAAPSHNVMSVVRRRAALADAKPLRALLETTFGDVTIQEGRIPLNVAATSLRNGKEKLLKEGRLVDALMASCAVPGVFPPVTIDGTPYVDGLLYGAPAYVAAEEGHTTIYLLVTNSDVIDEPIPRSWWGIARRAAMLVMWSQLTDPRSGPGGRVDLRVVGRPSSMPRANPWDFRDTEQQITDSYVAAKAWLRLRNHPLPSA